MTTFPGRLHHWRRTAAQFAAENPTLAAGEIGKESDTGLFKMGPGTWNTLDYANPPPTPIENLSPAAVPLGGDELLPGLQDAGAVKFTTDLLMGKPIEHITSMSRERDRWFTDFAGHTATATANAIILPHSNMLTAISGTGAQITQGATLGEFGIADLSTGTATTGRCGLTGPYPALYLFNNAVLIRFGARLRMPNVVSDGTNTYQVVCGFGDVTTLTPADAAIRFVSPAAAGNWSAEIRDDGTAIDTTDTGIATDHDGVDWYNLVVEFDPVFGGARWYINGVLVASETTLEPDALANISTWGVGIIKSAGATARILELDGASWDVHVGARWANLP